MKQILWICVSKAKQKKSKLGDLEDIKHELEWLENPNYAVIVELILKRPPTSNS